MTEVAEDGVQPATRTPSVLQVAVAFAGRGVLWGLLVVTVIGILSGFFGTVLLGLLPGVLGGAVSGFTTGLGAALAGRLAAPASGRRYVLAAFGAAAGAAVPLLLAWVWLQQQLGLLFYVAVVVAMAGALAPFALLRNDGVRRDRSRSPWLFAGLGMLAIALVLCSVRGQTASDATMPTWALVSAAVLAFASAAALIVALARRSRAHPEPAVSESDGVWGIIALGAIVLGVACVMVLVQVGAISGAIGS